MKSTNGPRLECMSGRRAPGEYYYISPGQEKESVCGLYIMGMSNQLIELEFTDFNIECSPSDAPKGILVVVDGWELNGEYFPGPDDHPQPMEERMKWYCGAKKPRTVLISGQNGALVQFIIPKRGQGFSVRVRMPQNPQPCNVISTYVEGLYTIRNFGRRLNCSMSILYPENIRFLSVDVGVSSTRPHAPHPGKCNRETDYVELLDGNGLEPEFMTNIVRFCGQSTQAATRNILLGCNNSVVRLVSSGNYHNSVTFSYTEPSKDELEEYGSCDVSDLDEYYDE